MLRWKGCVKMIKAVFIDIDNTLLDFNACAKTAIRLLFDEYNREFTEEVFDVFLRINDRLWLEIEKGTLTKDELHRIRWQLIFDELGISICGEEFEKGFIKTLITCAEPVDGARDILKYLSSKYPVFAVSNSGHNQQMARLEKAGMAQFVQKVFLSETIGFSKPRKEFFDGCFSELSGLSPENVIIIGDSLSADIAGGAGYGLKTCWFNFLGEKLPESITPDYIVTRLSDIKNIL